MLWVKPRRGIGELVIQIFARNKDMYKRVLNILFAIFTFPVCAGLSLGFYESLSRIKIMSYYQQKYFIVGAVSYLAVHAIVLKPAYLYILGHELMHAIAALLSGGKVRSIKVSSRGGSVATTKSNAFIALSPYFFPVYTIMVSLVWFAVNYFLKVNLNYGLFLFAIGFTLMFHIVLTIDFLKIKQTDLLHAGYLFSICLIYIVNLIVIGFIFSMLFQNMIFMKFLQDSYLKTKDIYSGIFHQLFL
jgi:hypothetical protein